MTYTVFVNHSINVNAGNLDQEIYYVLILTAGFLYFLKKVTISIPAVVAKDI